MMALINFTIPTKIICPEGYLCAYKDAFLQIIKDYCFNVKVQIPINMLAIAMIFEIVDMIVGKYVFENKDKVLFYDYTVFNIFMIMKGIKLGLIAVAIAWMLWGFNIVHFQ